MANEDNQSGSPIYEKTSNPSIDPRILQRPPSFHSIRSVKHEDSYTVPSSSNDTISEENVCEFTVNPDHRLDISECPSFSVGKNIIKTDESAEKEKENPSSGAISETRDETIQERDNDEDTFYESSEDISEHGGCIECVKAIPVLSAEEIDKGDHIVFAGAVYDHHGIVVSKCQEDNTLGIVEATNSFFGATAGLILGGKAQIQNSQKKFNFKTDNICIVFYKNRKFSKQETVDRAMKFVSSDSGGSKFEYHLLVNNCEHFATFCVTGKRFSIQVRKCVMIAKLMLFGGFRGISDENLRNEKQYENKIICKKCYQINKRLLSATIITVKSHNDVHPGDIIRYSYCNLWHDAVVLHIIPSENNYILCEIAHYCFHGPLSHREIIREELKIYFNGSVSVVHYDPSQYDLFNPDEVVQRATRRIGEKFFVFFSNDSSHFARWCKLKLTKEKVARGETEV